MYLKLFKCVSDIFFNIFIIKRLDRVDKANNNITIKYR